MDNSGRQGMSKYLSNPAIYKINLKKSLLMIIKANLYLEVYIRHYSKHFKYLTYDSCFTNGGYLGCKEAEIGLTTQLNNNRAGI